MFPGLWTNLERMIEVGDLIASELVLTELEQVDDDLLQWAYIHRKMFVRLDQEIQEFVKSILRNHPTFVDAKKTRSDADPFVVALAKIHQATVVTNETPTGNPNQRMKIPDACNALNIPYMGLLEFFKKQGWTFL